MQVAITDINGSVLRVIVTSVFMEETCLETGRREVKEDLTLIKYIDPHGRTLFNAYQAIRLIEEIDILLNYVTGETKEDWLKIREAARNLRDGYGTYLSFR